MLGDIEIAMQTDETDTDEGNTDPKNPIDQQYEKLLAVLELIKKSSE